MSGKLKHMRHIKRGTPHVHACPCCSEWRVNPAVCTDERCDIVGVHIDCPSITEGERFPLGGHYETCDACAKRGDDCRSIDALHAFGRVIATIARTGLIARASQGLYLDSFTMRGAKNAAYYGPGPRWLVYLGGDSMPTHELHSWHPADAAAEVVSLLFGEAES